MERIENGNYDIDELLLNIEKLNEQKDESREYPFSPIMLDSSIHNDISTNQILHKNQTNKDPPKTLNEICRKETHSQWAHGIDVELNDELNKIKEMNRKLLSDNRALMRECVRLRKVVKEKGNENTGDQEYLNHAELVYMDNVNKFTHSQAEDLLQKFSFSQHPSKELHEVLAYCHNLMSVTTIISVKIEAILDKERSAKMKNSNTTTVTSRCEEGEVERIVNGVRSEYERQIKRLEEELYVAKKGERTRHRDYESPVNKKPFRM